MPIMDKIVNFTISNVKETQNILVRSQFDRNVLTAHSRVVH